MKTKAAVVSILAFVALVPIQAQLINIDFGSDQNPYLPPGIGPAAVGQTDADIWNIYSRDDEFGNWRESGTLSNLVQADGTPTAASISVNNAAGLWFTLISQNNMMQSYLYPLSGAGDITTSVTGLVPDNYDVYVYAHGQPNEENAALTLSVDGISYGSQSTSSEPGWDSVLWTEGAQYVVFRGIPIASGQTLNVVSSPGVSGLAVINGMQLVSLGGKLHPPHPQHPDHPEHPVHPTHPVNVPKIDLLNVDFGSSLNPYLPPGVGSAAVGISADDYWNLYSRDDEFGGWRDNGVLNELKLADGTPTPAELSVSNAAGLWFTPISSDYMFQSYLYPLSRVGDITATFTDLSRGTYDIYVYAHGYPPEENAVVNLSVGSVSMGTLSTSSEPGWESPLWTEGRQFVVFRNVSIDGGNDLTIVSSPGVSGLAVINGLQIISHRLNQ
jgi:hypothetical protein